MLHGEGAAGAYAYMHGTATEQACGGCLHLNPRSTRAGERAARPIPLIHIISTGSSKLVLTQSLLAVSLCKMLLGPGGFGDRAF